MKRAAIFSLLSLAFGVLFSPVSLAQDEAPVDAPISSKKADKKKQPDSPVVKAVKKMKKVKGRLNAKADYYIYLFSASWCGPCCKEMPEIVEHHKKMKKDGRVDIILMGKDDSPAEVKAFIKQFNMKFYAVMASDKDATKVPGFTNPSGIPFCIVVDRYGRVMAQSHPAGIIPNWEAYTIDKGVPEPPAETEK